MKKRRLAVAWILLCGMFAVPAQEFIRTTDAAVTIEEAPRYIALTFDDGPKEGTTDVLLDGLRERGAAATFFLVGDQAVMYPDLVRRMQAEGHQVGNHTWSHQRLEGNVEQAIDEVERMDRLLREILGEGAYWLRPPYGGMTEEIARQIQVPMVKWNIDPRDWESRNQDVVVQRILEMAHPNSIVLLHDIYPSSVEAALEVVDRLQEQGYWFVTVEELLRINGITPEAGKMYRSGA